MKKYKYKIFRKAYNKLVILLIVFLFSTNLNAQNKCLPVSVSLFHPLSTNNVKDTAGVNINLLYSKIAQVDYFNLGLGATFIEGRMNGVQIGIGLTYVDSVFNGISFTLGANIHNNDVNGFDFSLFTNMILGNLHGGVISGFYNFVIGNVEGFQISPFINVIGASAHALQIGNSNIAGKNFGGVQLGFVFNFIALKMKGLQIAIANLAGKNHGLQIGAANVTHTLKGSQLGLFNKSVISKGLQIGLINYSIEQEGVPVGLINISDDSKIHWLNYVSNFAVFNSGIKLTSNSFYSIIEFGWDHVRTNNRESYLLGYHYGYDFRLTNVLTVSPDLGYVQIFDKDIQIFKNNEFLHQFAVQARISVEYKINKFIGIFAGVGFSTNFILYRTNHSNWNKVIGFSGISIL